MAIDTFLHSLFDHGRLAVPIPNAGEGATQLAAARAILDGFEADWRLDFPGTAPRWDRESALFAARVLYRGAQGVVFRQIDSESLQAGFDLPLPDGVDTPSAHYSVDVTLRFLPDLARMARGASADDPLVGLLDTLARQWPLSSVGMPDVEPASIEPVAGHPGLLRLYVDRIVAAADLSRLGDPRVADATRRVVGAHDELCPVLSRAFSRGDDR